MPTLTLGSYHWGTYLSKYNFCWFKLPFYFSFRRKLCAVLRARLHTHSSIKRDFKGFERVGKNEAIIRLKGKVLLIFLFSPPCVSMRNPIARSQKSAAPWSHGINEREQDNHCSVGHCYTSVTNKCEHLHIQTERFTHLGTTTCIPAAMTQKRRPWHRKTRQTL